MGACHHAKPPDRLGPHEEHDRVSAHLCVCLLADAEFYVGLPHPRQPPRAWAEVHVCASVHEATTQCSPRKFRLVTRYNISKFGMTLTALGIAQEYEGLGVAGNSIWCVAFALLGLLVGAIAC